MHIVTRIQTIQKYIMQAIKIKHIFMEVTCFSCDLSIPCPLRLHCDLIGLPTVHLQRFICDWLSMDHAFNNGKFLTRLHVLFLLFFVFITLQVLCVRCTGSSPLPVQLCHDLFIHCLRWKSFMLVLSYHDWIFFSIR